MGIDRESRPGDSAGDGDAAGGETSDQSTRHTRLWEMLRGAEPPAAVTGAAEDRAEVPSEPPSGRSRWRLLEQFVHGGFVYQLRRRPVEPADVTPKLTPREEQVLAGALGGESNKSIAYTLGLSPSTVGVLLFRAAAKLGTKSRDDLLSTYAKRERPPEE